MQWSTFWVLVAATMLSMLLFPTQRLTPLRVWRRCSAP